jgi:excisionase family DNA binding protein
VYAVTFKEATVEQAANNKLNRREQLAERLGVSLRTADELIASQQIKSLKIGRRRLVSESAIAAFIAKQEKANR